MSAYWIHYPVREPGPPHRVSLFMTRGDSSYLADGTHAFVREVLAAVEVREPLLAFRFQRYRSCYFADDSEPPDWRDLWVPTWKLTAELAEAPASLDVLAEDGRRETAATDRSWSFDDDLVNASPSRCLLIADFDDEAARDAARARVHGAALAEGQAFGRFAQLHVDLGDHDDAWYAAGAPEAVAVRALLEAHGARTFWNHTAPLAWR